MNELQLTSLPGLWWPHGFLVLLLFLLASNVYTLVKGRSSGSARYSYLGVVISLALLFNHIAFYYTTTGWPSTVMKTISLVWTVFMLVYGSLHFAGLRGRPK